MNSVAQKLKSAFFAGQFKNHISHIRFPAYKNLSADLRINFTFPITALVGGNGSNKTSILRALEACPRGYDLGNWWFSTSMDPIPPGLHPRYIYGFSVPGLVGVAEVRKSRTERKDRRSDYFETTKPADGMAQLPLDDQIGQGFRTKTRWMPLGKNVVYLDFRGELPAYEKFMQHPATRDSKKDLEERKEWLRDKSAKVRIALEGKAKKDTYYNRKVIHEIVTLSNEAVGEIGDILGREYSSIRMIRHDYFERPGWTVELTTDQHVYSEAYAGSGEFAIIVMVHQILSAPKSSLILLDEPETSLHPASQEKLMAFLCRRSLKDKHQVVMATHSPHIIRPLPDDAIKLLTVDPGDGKVHLISQENSQTDAFFRLGSPKEGKLTIFVEDNLAANLVGIISNSLGQAKFERLEFKPYPGGASEIKKRLIPHLAQTDREDAIVILDGDMLPARRDGVWTCSDERNLIDPATVVDNDVAAAFADCFSDGSTMELSLNGGNDPNIDSHVTAMQRATLKWVEQNVYFLPGSSPEELVCELLSHPFVSSKEAKNFFVAETAKELSLPGWRHNEISADRILETQVRALAKLDLSDGHWQTLRAVINARL